MNPGSSRVSKAVGTSGKGPKPGRARVVRSEAFGDPMVPLLPPFVDNGGAFLAVKFAADLSGHFFESNESSAGLTRGAHNR